jgi:hypothetical protein
MPAITFAGYLSRLAGQLGHDNAGGTGIAPIARQVATLFSRDRFLEDLLRRAEGFGESPAFAARFEMFFDELVARRAGWKRAARQNRKDLIAIHRYLLTTHGQ